MIAYKRFTADGVTNRFLSDIIIRSEQFTRVYSYVYDNTLNIDGSEDVLQNPLLPWAYPTNLYRRGANFPNSSFDLINLDKWDLADNSILFYTVPPSGSKVYIEVATTAEEFGSTLTAPAVNRAEAAAVAALASEIAAGLSEAAAALSETNAAASETAAGLSAAAAALSETNANASKVAAALSESNAAASETAAGLSETNAAASEAAAAISETNAGASATNAQLREWEAEADALTALSYASEAEDVLVNLVTSDGDGTFTYTPQVGVYSAKHHELKAAASAASINPANLLHTIGTGAGNPEGYTSAETDTQISNRMSGFKNGIINPSFEINQYADIDTAPVDMVAGTYQIDRFVSYFNGTTGTIKRNSKALINGKYVNSVRVTSTLTASGWIGLEQRSELFYNGETKTFGVWVKSNSASARLVIYDGITSTVSTPHTGTGTYEFLEVPKSISASATALRCYVAIISATATAVSVINTEYIESTMWQLEDGSVATKFEQRDKNFEKDVLCKPFLPYRNGGLLYTRHGQGLGISATSAVILVETKASSRIIPLSATYAGNLALFNGTTYVAVTSISINTGCTKDILVLTVNVASGLAAGQLYQLVNNNNATAYLQVQTEL